MRLCRGDSTYYSGSAHLARAAHTSTIAKLSKTASSLDENTKTVWIILGWGVTSSSPAICGLEPSTSAKKLGKVSMVSVSDVTKPHILLYLCEVAL